MGEKLVAETLALGSSFDDAGDVDELHRRGHDGLGLHDGDDAVHACVRHTDDAHIGVNRAKRVIGGLRLGGRERVEDGGLAYIRQPYDSTIKSHVPGSFPSLLLEHARNGSWIQDPVCAAALPKAFSPRAICRRSFGLSTSARRSIWRACVANTCSISRRPDAVRSTTRTRRSSELLVRVTSPRFSRRSTATEIEPGVRKTLGPIVFTGIGPLCSSASRIRNSDSPRPLPLSVCSVNPSSE